MIKTVFQKINRVIILVGRFFPHDHADETDSVPLGKGDQGLAGLVGVSGFSPDHVFTVNFPGEKIVGVEDPEIIRLSVGLLKMVVHLGHVIDQVGIFKDFLRNQRHVMGTCVVVGFVESV